MTTAAAFDVRAQPTEAVACALCGTTPYTVVATQDRYGLPTRVVQCVSCRLRFQNPRMTKAAFGAFYQHGYRPLLEQHYARLGADAPTLAAIEADQMTYAANLLREVEPVMVRRLIGRARLLDVGGSTGIVGRVFGKRWGFDVTVIDPSADELARAKGCATICGSAEDVTFPKADVALMCRTVDHLLDPVSVLARLRQAVRLLVIDAMDVDRWGDAHRYKVDHPYAFTRDTLRRLVEAAGWHIRHEWQRRHGQYVGLVCSPQE